MAKSAARRQDYLKLIDQLSRNGKVRGVDLARELGVSRPTVSVFLKQLSQAGDIFLDSHHSIRLTDQGKTIANSIQEKNQILFTLLHSLGVPEDVAEYDACCMEHFLSDRSFEALKRLLEERQSSDESS